MSALLQHGEVTVYPSNDWGKRFIPNNEAVNDFWLLWSDSGQGGARERVYGDRSCLFASLI